MKKLFVYFYDKVNLGDDLFVRMLAKRYSHACIYIWSDKKNRNNFSDVDNIVVIDKNSIFVKMLDHIRPSLVFRYKQYLLKHTDAVVYIGGSIFIEYPNWERSVEWWKDQAVKYPFFALGANFGPFKSHNYVKQMNQVFAIMQDVCFRDGYSYNLFKNNQKVRWAPDIIYGYQIPKIEINKNQVFISVINCYSKDEGCNKLSQYQANYFVGMLSIVKEFVNQGCKVVLSSFCKEEGDETMIDQILNQLNEKQKKNCTCVNYNGKNTDEMLLNIAESKYVIASRFHAVILAMIASRPVVPFVYSDKTIHVLQEMGFGEGYIDIRNMTGDEAGNIMNLFMRYTPINILKMKMMSEEHFKRLDVFIGFNEK